MSSDAAAAANDRLATKQIRLEINRILLGWDPLYLKGLRGADRGYEEFVGPISILVKKGVHKMEIASHLRDLLVNQWRMPEDNPKCVEVATRLYNVGALFRGELDAPP